MAEPWGFFWPLDILPQNFWISHNGNYVLACLCQLTFFFNLRRVNLGILGVFILMVNNQYVFNPFLGFMNWDYGMFLLKT